MPASVNCVSEGSQRPGFSNLEIFFCAFGRAIFREGTYPVEPGSGGLSFASLSLASKEKKNLYAKTYQLNIRFF